MHHIHHEWLNIGGGLLLMWAMILLAASFYTPG
jgi:hypothetical protein